MKLALVSHNVITGDGQGRVNVALARHLLRCGVHVTLIADRVEPALLDEGAGWVRVHPGFERLHLARVWRFRRQVDRLLPQIEERFDLVVACGVVLSRPHAVNVVHFAHGGWRRSPYHAAKVQPGVNGAYQWLFSACNDRWERETLARAERVVAVSEMVKEELVGSGVPAGKVQVIVNGVDLEAFAPGPADRAALGLPEGVPLGLFVGDLRSPIKNADTLLRALAEAPGAHLAVAGRLEGSALPALAKRLGIAERVHFLGFRRDVAALMRAADFFALPSRRDSCPLVLLEAMASALPVITARTVGTAGLVSSECGTVLERPDDRRALTEAVRAMVAHPQRRRAMGRAARAVAEAHSWEHMARQYLHVFRMLERRTEPTVVPEWRLSKSFAAPPAP